MQLGNSLVLSGFLNSLISAGGLSVAGNVTIGCYKGVMPTDAELQAFTPASRSSDLLATFTGATFQASGNSLSFNATPANASVVAAGTISWAAIQGLNNVNILVEPSLAGGPGSIILSRLDVTAGQEVGLTASSSGVSFAFSL